MTWLVDRATFGADAADLAPRLLNKLLEVEGAAGRIVEVEAYGGADDPASHARRGPTSRNAEMFRAGGRLYVYLVYGLHTCANVVSGPEGDGQAVLIRAVEPVRGEQEMKVRRPVGRRRDLCNGPGKLTEALGITLGDGGAALGDPSSRVRLVDDGIEPPGDPARGPRIGISAATDRPWRFWVPGSEWVSR